MRTAGFLVFAGTWLAALVLAGAAAQAQSTPHPFPLTLERGEGASGMRAPGLLSGPRRPLLPMPRSGYGSVLSAPVRGTPQPLFLGILGFYRTVVSPVNGSNSDLAPVQSLYAVQAIKTHGVLLGSVLTTARLQGEASVIPHAPKFNEDGRVFFYDPLHWNTYWLPDWLLAGTR